MLTWQRDAGAALSEKTTELKASVQKISKQRLCILNTGFADDLSCYAEMHIGYRP